jgi:phage/plasmid primase-like uncharacterized protein
VPIEEVLAPRDHHLRRCGGELIGPCPVCGGRDRFAINPKKAVWNCRNCRMGGDVIDLVRHLDDCGFNDAIEQLTGERSVGFDPVRHAKTQADADRQRRQHEKAAWLWSQRRPIEGTIAEVYLRQARAITCPLPPTLAFLPPRKPDHHPALIAAFSLPGEIEPGSLGAPGNLESVHLTLLRSDGSGKAEVGRPKLFVGSPGNLPIVLAPLDDRLGMAITEGIEDALTVHQATGLGVWAAGAAGRMPAFADTVPRYIESITICAHSDQAGRNGALALADALDRRGVEVFIEGIQS